MDDIRLIICFHFNNSFFVLKFSRFNIIESSNCSFIVRCPSLNASDKAFYFITSDHPGLPVSLNPPTFAVLYIIISLKPIIRTKYQNRVIDHPPV